MCQLDGFDKCSQVGLELVWKEMKSEAINFEDSNFSKRKLQNPNQTNMGSFRYSVMQMSKIIFCKNKLSCR